MKTALIIVDLQNDFCPGGTLAVKEGDTLAKAINPILSKFDVVVATQDWHPADHGSFAVNHEGKNVFDLVELGGLPQVLWPAHCIQNTPGAELVGDLDRSKIDHITVKGTNPAVDSYSGFADNGGANKTDLEEWLRDNHVTKVYICGIATDYCVKATAIDAAKAGFHTHVLMDLCRGVSPESIHTAVGEMRKAGVVLETGFTDGGFPGFDSFEEMFEQAEKSLDYQNELAVLELERKQDTAVKKATLNGSNNQTL